MPRLDIKPLSVNEVWQGKRYKTKQYKKYEKDVLAMLTAMKIPQGPKMIRLDFGFSNDSSDFDNPVKPFMDILQKRYGFNDREIYVAIITKTIVPKGHEFIRFDIKEARTI
jgi:Holliday junction resolvase RusA-like endonuclease